MKRKFNWKNQKPIRQLLRNRMTDAERILWYYLRKRFVNGFRFRRQYGIGPYVVDFYCPEVRLVIEVDGDSHYQPKARIDDAEKQDYIKNLGIKIIRFTNIEIREGIEGVIEIIRQELCTLSNSPSKRGRSYKDGFTLIELLLSVAIIVIITVITLSVSRPFQTRNDLDIAAATAVQNLHRAQTLAQGVAGDTSWGVNIATSTITLFRGTSFASRDINYDETFEVPTTISPAGLTEIIFTKFTGNPTATGTLRFIGVNNETRTVTVNERGMVSY